MDKIVAKNKYMSVALRILAGGVFIFSAVMKYLSIEDFDMYIYEHRILGFVAAELTSRLLISAELCLGIFIIAGVFLRFTKYVMLGLLAAFTVYLVIQPVFGVDTTNCHCFGNNFTLNRIQSLIKNIVLIAIVLPINPDVGFAVRYNKTVFFVVSLAAVIATMSINTPSVINNALYGNTASIDGDLYAEAVKNSGKEEFLQGKQIICFYSTACKYCKKAAKKINIAMEKENINSENVKIVFWQVNDEVPVENFFERAGVPPLEYAVFPVDTFLTVTGGIMPLILFSDNGKPAEVLKYIVLNETLMKDFIAE
ncbi:MAG: DoxX family protein [Bacteroidales bacterium]|nr:DoxX family protein [Bacteroidales bacterium]